MEVLSGLGVDILASALSAGFGFGIARLLDYRRKRRKLGHVLALLGSSKSITIVFTPGITESVTGVPENAVRMSLVEGAAIARIGQICRDARPGTEMSLIHPDEHSPNRGPFVMVGDPSRSAWSSNWIDKHFPQLEFRPDRRRLDYDNASWETGMRNNVVEQDFGFIMVGRTENSVRFVLLWGASEFGTNIAARAFADLHHFLRREDYGAVVDGEARFFVARAEVERYGVRTDGVSVPGQYKARH